MTNISVLENVLQRQLHNARVACGPDQTKERAGCVRTYRVVRVQMIRQVERFNAELNGLTFRDVEGSRQAGVDGDSAWACIHAAIAPKLRRLIRIRARVSRRTERRRIQP